MFYLRILKKCLLPEQFIDKTHVHSSQYNGIRSIRGESRQSFAYDIFLLICLFILESIWKIKVPSIYHEPSVTRIYIHQIGEYSCQENIPQFMCQQIFVSAPQHLRESFLISNSLCHMLRRDFLYQFTSFNQATRWGRLRNRVADPPLAAMAGVICFSFFELKFCSLQGFSCFCLQHWNLFVFKHV